VPDAGGEGEQGRFGFHLGESGVVVWVLVQMGEGNLAGCYGVAEALRFLVLERELDPGAVKDHLIVIDGQVELLNLRDP